MRMRCPHINTVIIVQNLICADHRGPPGDPMSTGEALIVRIGCGGVMFGLGGTMKASFPRSGRPQHGRVPKVHRRRGVSAAETKRKRGAGHHALVQCPILMPKVGGATGRQFQGV